MALKDTCKNMKDLLDCIQGDLSKAEEGNKAAAQRVRTCSIKFEKAAKLYRKESVKAERSGSSKKKPAKKGKAPTAAKPASGKKAPAKAASKKAPAKPAASKKPAAKKAAPKKAAKPKTLARKKPTAKLLKTPAKRK